jgi:hypothetical protein
VTNFKDLFKLGHQLKPRMTALVVVQPQRHLRRWVSTALALLVAVAVVCAVCSRPLSDEQLLQAPASKATPSVAAVEALAVKNAAVQSAVYNTRLMTLINHAQQNKPISLSSVQAVRDLSDSDLTDMIRSAEAHIVTKAQDGAAQLAEKPSAPLSPSGQTAAQRTMQVVSANGGSVDLKSISSAFEAHLEHEMTTAKALMAETSARKHAASRLPAAGADPMSVMKAQLDSSEKAEEDKMKEHFLKERENVIAMFKKHVSAAAPAPAVATPPSPPARHSHKSLANMHMVQHLVFGHQDNVNDAQYATAAPCSCITRPLCLTVCAGMVMCRRRPPSLLLIA